MEKLHIQSLRFALRKLLNARRSLRTGIFGC